MKNIARQLAAFAFGLVAILFIGFAALGQTPSDSVAKPDWLASYAKKAGHNFLEIRPRGGCFCDEDCYAAMLERQKHQPQFRLNPSSLKFKTEPADTKSEPDVRVIDLEGLKKILQRDANDKRPLLLNFWATWCDPCREEFPDLVKLDADYKDKGLNFIAISIDDITDLKSEVPKFLNQMKATMPVALLDVKDPEPAIKIVDPTWDGQLPATFLYDKDGKVVFKHFGKIKPDELRAAIDKELKK